MTVKISQGSKKFFFLTSFNSYISISVSLVELYLRLQLAVKIPVKLVEGLGGQLDLHEGAGGHILVHLHNVVCRLRDIGMVQPRGVQSLKMQCINMIFQHN